MFLCPSNSLFPSVDTWKNKQTKILFNLISQINYIFNFLLIVFTFKCPSWCFTSRVIHGTCLHINPFLSFKTAYSHENDVSCSDSLSSEWCLRQQNVTVSELNNHVKCLAQSMTQRKYSSKLMLIKLLQYVCFSFIEMLIDR